MNAILIDEPLRYIENMLEHHSNLMESAFLESLHVNRSGKETFIYDYRFPTGTIACDLLNIPEDILNEAEKSTEMMLLVTAALQYEHFDFITPNGFEKARQDALHILKLFEKQKPFIYFEKHEYVKHYNELFKPVPYKGIRNSTNLETVNKSLTAIQSLICNAASLRGFIQMVEEFTEKTDADTFNRDVSGYADIYAEMFGENCLEVCNWIPYASCIQRTFAENGRFGVTTRYPSLLELIADDFTEGLRLGHAPKKCKMCGRYFLTTDAHHPHYCNEVYPGDPRGRTCRKLAKLKGSTEKALDNPRIVIKNKALANLRQAKARKTVSETEYEVISGLINEKSERAAEKPDYCNGAYQKEMSMKNLKEEAGRLIAC